MVLQMVEGGGAAEIAALDERHRQPTLRRVGRDRQAVNTATDDEQIEGASAEPPNVSDHRSSHERPSPSSPRAREPVSPEPRAPSPQPRAPSPEIVYGPCPPPPRSGNTGKRTSTISKSRSIRSARAGSSRISISITSRSCITCCVWWTSMPTAGAGCSRSDAEPRSISPGSRRAAPSSRAST